MLAGQDLMILLAIAFFIFGAKKLPEIGSGLGKALRDFKDGLNGIERGTFEAPLKNRRRRQKIRAYRSLDNLPF